MNKWNRMAEAIDIIYSRECGTFANGRSRAVDTCLKMLKLTKSNLSDRRHARALEFVWINFCMFYDADNVDTNEIFDKNKTKQPKIFAEVKTNVDNNVECIKFAISFDKRILYFPREIDFSKVLLTWISFHYIFDLEIEPYFKGLFGLIDLVLLKIEKKKSFSMHVKKIATEVLSLT